LVLIEKFGADGVRCGLLHSASAGDDILFDEELCNQGKGVANKIWNAFRLIKGWEVADIAQPEHSKVAVNWFENKFQKTLAQINDDFDNYRMSNALMAIYRLTWYDFCSWYLQLINRSYQHPIAILTFDKVFAI